MLRLCGSSGSRPARPSGQLPSRRLGRPPHGLWPGPLDRHIDWSHDRRGPQPGPDLGDRRWAGTRGLVHLTQAHVGVCPEGPFDRVPLPIRMHRSEPTILAASPGGRVYRRGHRDRAREGEGAVQLLLLLSWTAIGGLMCAHERPSSPWADAAHSGQGILTQVTSGVEQILGRLEALAPVQRRSMRGILRDREDEKVGVGRVGADNVGEYVSGAGPAMRLEPVAAVYQAPVCRDRDRGEMGKRQKKRLDVFGAKLTRPTRDRLQVFERHQANRSEC